MKEKIKLGGKDFTEGMREEYNLRPSTMKSRGNYAVGVCINKVPCKWQGIKCDDCFKKKFYEEKE